jgi:EmrB/QacA subfamily drug resistance transporter
MREFHASLSSVQWVITGYSLVFGSLLVVGGRLGDVHGHRRTFVIGCALFGLGSLLATLSWSVPSLFVGEAIVEGIGASLMLPAALAMISTGFHGRDRATAFAMLGAAAGLGTALGPLLGGFFTSELSWRLAFGLNVLIAPLAVAGVLLFFPASPRSAIRRRVDVVGSVLFAFAMFLLVFGISEGRLHGWWEPRGVLTVAGVAVWPTSRPVSVIPVTFLVAIVLLVAFFVVERRKERAGRDPLFEFGELRHPGFRYGLLTSGVLSLGALSLVLVLSVLLQEGIHLSAVEVGVWLIPLGVFIAVGARVGAMVANRFDPAIAVRAGLAVQVAGIALVVWRISPQVGFWDLVPGLSLYGFGAGASNSQLVNVILSDVPSGKAGVASGANSTMRQVGSALGVALVTTVLSVQTIRNTTANLRNAEIARAPRLRAIELLDRLGAGFRPPPGSSPRDARAITTALVQGLTDAARPTLWWILLVAVAALGASLLIPRVPLRPATDDDRLAALRDAFESPEPYEPSPDLVPGPGRAPA